MTDTRYPPFRLVHDTARRMAAAACLNAPAGWVARISEPTRSGSQNDRMWALLTEVANQVEWYGRKLTPEDWKIIFSSSLKKLDVVPNIEGSGFVALGLSTSKMSKRELSDLMMLIEAFAVEHDVVLHDERSATLYVF